MSVGLFLRDRATGLTLIDTSTAIVMPIGIFTIGGDGAAMSGDYTDLKLTRGRPIAMVLQAIIGTNTTNRFIGQAPVLSYFSSGIHWEFPTTSSPNPPICKILYGIE